MKEGAEESARKACAKKFMATPTFITIISMTPRPFLVCNIKNRTFSALASPLMDYKTCR